MRIERIDRLLRVARYCAQFASARLKHFNPHTAGSAPVSLEVRLRLMKSQFRFKNPSKLIDGDIELVLMEKRPADPNRKRSPCYVFEMRKSYGTAKIGTNSPQDRFH
jgi:hypothetical protein